jgi:L-2,4-diaminobutyrate decarboxylase
VHRFDAVTDDLADAILRYALDRMRMDPPPLDRPRRPGELAGAIGEPITERGLGATEALRLFTDVVAPANISVDHPRFWAFVGVAPTEAASLFDLVVGASSLYGGSWLEGSGTTFAENQALRWVAELAGLPPSAGGTFVAGGTAGNLSALVAARHRWRAAEPSRARRRGIVAASTGAHSSIATAARVMDLDLLDVAVDERGRLTAGALRDALAEVESPEDVFAVVATAGTTNVGVVDDLAGVAAVARARDLWFHVDGAYGAAALLSPRRRSLFEGIEWADSLIVDPHKWLFAPYDCCALVYRDPATARAAHRQHGEYLDVLSDSGDWNPSDYAVHLTRRARGMPLWFSLVTHGTAAYRGAVEASINLAETTARLIDSRPHVELCLEPELSVVVFRRLGWVAPDYHRWSQRLLDDGVAFVVPTTWRDEPVMRFCFVNPRTTIDDVRAVLDTMEHSLEPGSVDR